MISKQPVNGQVAVVIAQLSVIGSVGVGELARRTEDPAGYLLGRGWWHVRTRQPSTDDMAGKLRRVTIATRFWVSRPDQPTLEEINVIRLVWEALTHNREVE